MLVFFEYFLLFHTTRGASFVPAKDTDNRIVQEAQAWWHRSQLRWGGLCPGCIFTADLFDGGIKCFGPHLISSFPSQRSRLLNPLALISARFANTSVIEYRMSFSKRLASVSPGCTSPAARPKTTDIVPHGPHRLPY